LKARLGKKRSKWIKTRRGDLQFLSVSSRGFVKKRKKQKKSRGKRRETIRCSPHREGEKGNGS